MDYLPLAVWLAIGLIVVCRWPLPGPNYPPKVILSLLFAVGWPVYVLLRGIK